jgi:hypothetical protein
MWRAGIVLNEPSVVANRETLNGITPRSKTVGDDADDDGQTPDSIEDNSCATASYRNCREDDQAFHPQGSWRKRMFSYRDEYLRPVGL